ncbi:Mif2/CENP-C like-domain-containing protein [Dipodascopsis uninucleata]
MIRETANYSNSSIKIINKFSGLRTDSPIAKRKILPNSEARDAVTDLSFKEPPKKVSRRAVDEIHDIGEVIDSSTSNFPINKGEKDLRVAEDGPTGFDEPMIIDDIMEYDRQENTDVIQEESIGQKDQSEQQINEDHESSSSKRSSSITPPNTATSSVRRVLKRKNLETTHPTKASVVTPEPQLQSLRKLLKRKDPGFIGSFSGSNGEESGSVRRSTRLRVEPLQYWKNERIVYNLVHEDQHSVPTIKQIVRSREDKDNSIRENSRRGSTTSARNKSSHNAGAKIKRRRSSEQSLSNNSKRSRTESYKVSDQEENVENVDDSSNEELSESETVNENLPEAGEIIGQVKGFPSGDLVERRIGIPNFNIEFNEVSTKSSNFFFAKTFEEGQGYLTTGIVKLPAKFGSKGRKPTQMNTLIFFVVEGTVEVIIGTTFIFKISKNGHFVVPRGNSYALRNLSQRQDAVLFYTQGTDTLENVELIKATEE